VTDVLLYPNHPAPAATGSAAFGQKDALSDGLTERSVMKRSELADLAAFVAIGELLSFRAAAARLGITRSALSHAMQQLENRLDVRLCIARRATSR
jgi:Bacterial regulatory helix-turn-helix protein, lysR family